MKPEDSNGQCLECGKELKFISIAKGYQRFCHNSACNVVWHNKNSGRLEQSSNGIKLARSSGDNIPTQLGYWLKKGFSEDEAKAKLKERQSTNTIKKLGEEKWRKRQLQWLNTMNAKSEKEKDRIAILKTTAIGIISRPERELSKVLFNFGFLTKTQICLHENDKRYVYDISCKNKLIEFNGDYWHCNPNKYSSDYYNKSKRLSAQQIWDNDKKKICVAESQGYKVLTIWESDWKINKQKCIDECVRFLNDD
jgi:G:T-mismatch repair DNA endonuclease (very short patch repair protein)